MNTALRVYCPNRTIILCLLYFLPLFARGTAVWFDGRHCHRVPSRSSGAETTCFQPTAPTARASRAGINCKRGIQATRGRSTAVLRMHNVILTLLYAFSPHSCAPCFIKGTETTKVRKTECAHALKGLALPRARHSGEIALAYSRPRLRLRLSFSRSLSLQLPKTISLITPIILLEMMHALVLLCRRCADHTCCPRKRLCNSWH